MLAVLLNACGGGSNPPVDPLASFKRQKLVWQACDATLMGEGENAITALGERAKCALMRAPLDYSNPAQGELQVALARVTAEQPQQRLGSIVFNPGGPGGDGLTFAPLFGHLFGIANPGDPSGKLLKEMSNRYDLVGFSPRGVGSSSSLTCSSPELWEVITDLRFDRSTENLKKAQHNVRLQAQACSKNPLTKYIHTDATARDMDLMREVLGDAKLNYIGYSYGTWLGSWYASLFPERVGRMLFDSSMNVVDSYDDATLLSEVGAHRVLNEVMIPYAARHPERFNLGSSAAQVNSLLLALPVPVKEALFPNIAFNTSEGIDSDLLGMTASVGLQALRARLPNATEAEFHDAIQTYAFTSGPDNLVAIDIAHNLAARLFAPRPRMPNVTGPQKAVYMSVVCNDMATRGDAQYWVDIGNQYAARYPLVGGPATANPCLYWTAPVTTRPSLAAATKAGPLLMLQSRYDAATPFEGAKVTLDALPNASMIVIEDEYKHGLFPYNVACVDVKVAEYFINGKMPDRMSSCPGKPLPADVVAAATQDGLVRKSVRVSESAVYTDPAMAQDTMRRIHRKMDGAARGI